MAHLQYLPGDPRLVDQLVCELKSKGIFDQFRKECIADVDTRPAYQNLRQRVESSVTSFLSRQAWKPDLNKNQLREKLRKHILDGNYLEQGVERIVDQVVNPKVATVFIPQVEDLVYNYYGITRKKTTAETSNGKVEDLLPNDLEAVSPGSVKSNDDKDEPMEIVKEDSATEEVNMAIDQDSKSKETNNDTTVVIDVDTQMSDDSDVIYQQTDIDIDKSNIPLPAEEIKPENIPPPDSSPPQFKIENIELPKDLQSTDIPLPDEIPSGENIIETSTLNNSDFDDSSSDSSLRRNMSPLTPVRNFDDENSYDAQQAFENESVDCKGDTKEPNTFRFTIESKSSENSREAGKLEKKDEKNLSYQFNNQVNINNYNTLVFEDSSNSHNLQIDYESDANSKAVSEAKAPETDQNSRESKKGSQKDDKEKKSGHKSSHKSRDSHRHSSSGKDKRSDSKHSSSRDRKDSKDKKGSKDEKPKPTHRERSRDRSDKKSSRDSSKQSGSHRSSSQKDKDSKSHKSSSSNKHSSKHSDDKKTSSSSSNQKEKSEKSSDRSSKDRRSSKDKSHRSDKDRKSSSKTKSDAKEREKKEKKEKDDHYSVSGRGNHNRRSTDRDSNDGSSSSKGWSSQPSSKTTENNKEKKENNSKSDNTTSNSTSPCDKDDVNHVKAALTQPIVKPIVRVDTQLGTPYSTPPRLAFVPDVTLKKPKIAANLKEAKQLVKMRKFLDEEQKRMNQEAALLLEFQANVRPSLSQIYSSIPGPELEFACEEKASQMVIHNNINSLVTNDNENIKDTHLMTNDNDTSKTEIEHECEIVNKNCEVIVITDDDGVEDNNKEQAEVISIEQQIENMDKFNVSDTAIIDNDDYIEIVDTQDNKNVKQNIEDSSRRPDYFEITIITEQLSENEEDDKNPKKLSDMFKGNVLKYFGEEEKFNAELEREKFASFFKTYTANDQTNKLYIFNCDPYQEDLIKKASEKFGNYDIVNYHKNGHFKLSKPKDIKDLRSEIKLPIDNKEANESQMFSPTKSECSFELSNDYDAKLQEMVKKTTKQEIMEIIMGCASDSSQSKMPTINYCQESNIESHEQGVKRKSNEIDTIDNNNRKVLTSNKIRRLSDSEQISSTTEENEEMKMSNVKTVANRTRCSGKLKKDGLPKHPRKSNVSNGPLSDKSVENLNSNNAHQAKVPMANGKIPNTARNKVQRYEVSDLYKPKLHYLSRRNNVN